MEISLYAGFTAGRQLHRTCKVADEAGNESMRFFSKHTIMEAVEKGAYAKHWTIWGRNAFEWVLGWEEAFRWVCSHLHRGGTHRSSGGRFASGEYAAMKWVLL